MPTDSDTAYAFEMLAGAVARGTDGIAAAPGGTDRHIADRILAGLRILQDRGLAEQVTVGRRVLGAQLTPAGIALGARLAAEAAPPTRRPGDVLDVAVHDRRPSDPTR